MRYIRAFAQTLPPGPVVVSYDGRATGPMLVAAVESALMACGRSVLSAGPAATPTTGVLVRRLSAAGGVQVSASHNPPTDNGLKLFSAAGRVIPAAEGARVLDRYTAPPEPWAAYQQVGRSKPIGESDHEHLRLVLALVDVPRIRARQFRVLLDANHGAGAVLGRPLLEQLGCDVRTLGAEPDGLFDHPPEPTAENLQGVLRSVLDHKADLGFCQDPDADRLALIDEGGRYIGEEKTLALCVKRQLVQRPGPVVTNCSTSRMTEDLCKLHGAPFYRSAVGEANVVDKMLSVGAVLGGEGNGGVIHPGVVLVRDSLTGMALVLDLMAQTGAPLSALADALPRYAIHKTKAALPREEAPRAMERLAGHYTDATPDRQDGLRLDWPDGRWLLVRASNTEPIVRVVAEAEEAPTAQSLAEACVELLEGRNPATK